MKEAIPYVRVAKRKGDEPVSRRDIGKLLIIALVLILAVSLLGNIESMQGREETETVREAVKNAALTCFAVEGAYPESMDYLKENYHLVYNEDMYLITYDAFASNRIPDIYVMEKGATLP